MPSAAIWIGSENIRLSEVKSEKEIPYGITYMCNLKHHTNESLHKTETLTNIENKLTVTYAGEQRNKLAERDKQIQTTIQKKTDKQRVFTVFTVYFLYGTRNYTQCLVLTYNGM